MLNKNFEAKAGQMITQTRKKAGRNNQFKFFMKSFRYET